MAEKDDAREAASGGSSGGITGLAKRWFMGDTDAAPAATGEEPTGDLDTSALADLSAPTATASAPGDGATAQPAGESTSIADADYPTIYAKVVPDGDPNTDAILEAFEGMDGMPDDQRRKAIGAILKGMRANVGTIAQTAARRQKAVQQVAAHVRGETEKARKARTDALATGDAETRAAIAALQAQIAVKQAALDVETKRATDANAEAQGKQLAHETRAKAEELRIGKFTDFLRSLNAPAATKE